MGTRDGEHRTTGPGGEDGSARGIERRIALSFLVAMSVLAVSAPASYAVDKLAPTVSWMSPVAAGERFDVASGNVVLEASATDNRRVAVVEFWRWDHPQQHWVFVGSATSSPWRVKIPVRDLNLAWNQLNVLARDAGGNVSSSPFIWLYDTNLDKVICDGRFAGEWSCAEGGYSGASRSWADTYYFAGSHNCTRYVAHRLALAGYPDPGTSWGNAWEWASRAPGDRNAVPQVGFVAQWDRSPARPDGHVAVVEAVGLDMIEVTEDNWKGVTYRRQIATASPNWPSRFIHVLG